MTCRSAALHLGQLHRHSVFWQILIPQIKFVSAFCDQLRMQSGAQRAHVAYAGQPAIAWPRPRRRRHRKREDPRVIRLLNHRLMICTDPGGNENLRGLR